MELRHTWSSWRQVKAWKTYCELKNMWKPIGILSMVCVKWWCVFLMCLCGFSAPTSLSYWSIDFPKGIAAHTWLSSYRTEKYSFRITEISKFKWNINKLKFSKSIWFVFSQSPLLHLNLFSKLAFIYRPSCVPSQFSPAALCVSPCDLQI